MSLKEGLIPIGDEPEHGTAAACLREAISPFFLSCVLLSEPLRGVRNGREQFSSRDAGPCFRFRSPFLAPQALGAVEMWKSPWRFPRVVGTGGKPGFGFPPVSTPGISTAFRLSAGNHEGSPETGYTPNPATFRNFARSCALRSLICLAASVSLSLRACWPSLS